MTANKVSEEKLLTYRGRKYDLSRWIARHPGGASPIEAFLGTDATVPMHMFHDMRSPTVQRWLPKFDRGPDEERPLSAFDRDYLELEELFYQKGWFEPSLPWYIMKTGLLFVFLALALVLSNLWLKGLFLGLFIHQSAFLAHDTCHNAAFFGRWRGRMEWLLGSVCFGLNPDKWTLEHNLHHLITNRPLRDPQINNMPDLLYAYREVEDFEREKRPLSIMNKRMMGYAHLWFVPVMFLYGRINAIRAEVKKALKTGAKSYLRGLVIHTLIVGAVIASALIRSEGMAAIAACCIIPLVAFALSGTLNIQLLLSHGHRPRLYREEQEPLGMKIQIISNQNITTSFLTAWFHGGLDNHIEHHLFPRMPRHNLPKLRPHVKALCEKHGLTYQTDPFFKALWMFLGALKQASAPFRDELAALRNGGDPRASTGG